MFFVLTPHAAGSQIAQTLLGGTLPSWRCPTLLCLKTRSVWGLCFEVQM